MSATTTNDLIIDAHRIANIYAEDEEPTAAEMARGINYLNELLDSLSGSNIAVPYTNDVNFTTVAGQATYVASRQVGADIDTDKIVELIDVYLTLGGVRFPLVEIEHDEAFKLVRYPNAQTRPTQIFMQEKNFGTELTLFYTPDTAYSMTMRVKQVLANVELEQDLDNVPPYYRRFLRYALGRELHMIFDNSSWSDVKERQYQQLFTDMTANSDFDASLNLTCALRNRYIGWTKGSIIVG